MKIVHYCQSFSKLSQTFIYDYITELQRQGVENVVVTEARHNEKDRPFENIKIIEKPGLFDPERLLRRVGTAFRGDHPRIARWEILRRRLAGVIDETQPDLIHAHFGPAGVKVAPVAEQRDIPLVTSFYGHDISRLLQQKFWVDQYKQGVSQSDAVLALSKHMKSKLMDVGFDAEKISIIHLSRDLSKFNFYPVSAPVCKFVSVGRLTHKKGHFDTISSFKKLSDDGYDLELEIIGGGELRRELAQQVKRLGMEGVVRLSGALSNEKVITRMRESEAFILCSKTGADGDMEGTPTVFVEAQAMGLPCISTSHAGIPEMFPAQNKIFLAEEGDVADIVEKLKKLIRRNENELQKITRRGRNKIERDFNLKTEVNKLRNIYQRLNENAQN